MAIIPKFDKLLGAVREDGIPNDSIAPTGKPDGYISVVAGTLYFFSAGNRYKLIATLDNSVPGSPVGLLLSLTYP